MSEGPEGPYNPRAALAKLVQGQVERKGRKLSFYEQCAAFCALYGKLDSNVVAKAFGISPTAASQIGGCLQTDPRPYTIELATEGLEVVERKAFHRDMNKNRMADRKQRYQRVAEEFNRLGEEAFFDKYFPPEMATRMAKAKYDLEQERVVRKRQGSDPRANEGPDETTILNGEVIRVALYPESEDTPPGWYVVGEHMPLGKEMIEGGDRHPFPNKQAALKGAWTMNGYDAPRYILK
jgi:hypothetical protein